MNFQEQFSNYDFPLLGYIKIPRIPIPEEDLKRLNLNKDNSSEDYLKALANEGFKKKIESGIIPKDKSEIYLNRINHEISEITKLLFTDYILLIYHIIRFCKNNGILNSPSRGSCGGSLLLFALDVVKIDGEKHSLLFERFISAGRTEIKEFNGEKYILSANLADVDIDSDRNLKYKINEFVAATFPNKTAPIKTFGTLQGKSAIKEVLKAYEEFKEEDAKEVSNLIETVFGKVEEISDALEDNIKFKEWAVKHEKTVQIAQQINCLIKNTSVHASGIIVCDTELLDNMPLELSSDKKVIVGYDMEYAQMFGVKIDNLGLKNLGAIKTCLDLIGKKMEDIDVEDESIYKFLSETNHYRGVFQAEDGLGKSVMKKLKCKNIEDVILSIAIGRPGSMKFLDEILEVREGKKIRNVDSRIKDTLASTFNVIVYQESIMALARIMANFSPQEADGLRKGIGKKLKDKVLEYKEKFIERSLKNGFDEQVVIELWQTFEDSGDYLFNKCLSPDTIVETEDGYKMMHEIKIGNTIKSYNLDKNIDIFTEVLEIYENKAEIYEIELEDGRKIKSSLKHKYLCEDKKMRSLEQILTEKHKILTE